MSRQRLFSLSGELLSLTTSPRRDPAGVFGVASRSEALFGCLEYLPVILAISLFAAVPLHDILPLDYDDEKSLRSDTRSMSMRQPTKENRTLDLRGTSTHGSELNGGGGGGGGGRNGLRNRNGNGAAVVSEKMMTSGQDQSGQGMEGDDDDDDDGDGFAAEKRAAAERMRAREMTQQQQQQQRDGTPTFAGSEGIIREADEDEGVVTDESPTTMVGGAGSSRGSHGSGGGGSQLSRRVNTKSAASYGGEEDLDRDGRY